jgi:hypothetical protein
LVQEVVRVLALFLLLFSTAQAEFNIEYGKANLSAEWTGPTVVVNERWDNWLVGIGWTGNQSVTPDGIRNWYQENRPGEPIPSTPVGKNLFFHGQRLLRMGGFEIGIGPAYFQNENRALGKQFVVSASVGYHINDHVWIGIRHFSNAGSGKPNMGQDMLNIGYIF